MSSITRNSHHQSELPPPYQPTSYGTMNPPPAEKSEKSAIQETSYQNPTWQAGSSSSHVWDLPEGTYQGMLKRGRPEGCGTMVYKTDADHGQKEYVGNFKDGLPSGQGKMTWRNGDVYDGEWLNGQMHGEGLKTYAIGEEIGSYNGEWFEGQMHGQGVRIWEDSDIQFTGLFENGEPVHGTQKGPGNVIWTGEWRDGVFFSGTKNWVEEGHRQTETFVNGSPEQPGCCVLV